MQLAQCNKKCHVKVVKINAHKELRQRLISFGIIKDADLEILAVAPAKSTMEVRVGKMRLALRKEEAQLIEVEKYEQ